MLNKPAWIEVGGVTKFFSCRTSRTNGWGGAINMGAVKQLWDNQQVFQSKCVLCDPMETKAFLFHRCSASARCLLPPSFQSSKDETCNLFDKFNYATVTGVCWEKATQKVNILRRLLPFPFYLGKLVHSVISQLAHLWAAKVIGDRSGWDLSCGKGSSFTSTRARSKMLQWNNTEEL